MSTFRPFDWKRFREAQAAQLAAGPVPGLAHTTDVVGRLIFDRLAVAADVDPNAGTITFRDEDGTIWEVAIARSDAAKLRCEVDLANHSSK